MSLGAFRKPRWLNNYDYGKTIMKGSPNCRLRYSMRHKSKQSSGTENDDAFFDV